MYYIIVSTQFKIYTCILHVIMEGNIVDLFIDLGPGILYSLCLSIFIYRVCVTKPEIDTLNKNGEMGSKSYVLLDQG